ncbi:MAG: hypothetical protein JST89_01930 [Cyanobacteria bacterium SZAS-4]|nr:hypothetical protein [Cyanobacteria bacterium SZAS-4]
MVEFRWKTEGTRVAGSVTMWPSSVILLIIIGLAIAITIFLTGKVSQQESDYRAKKAVYEELMSRRPAPQQSREH